MGAILAVSLLLALPAPAQTLRSLQIPAELNLGVDADAADLMQLQLESTPRLELDLTARSALVVSARLRVDAEEQLEPGTPPLDNYAAGSKPATLGSAGTLELRDAYWEQRLNAGIARVGKQQIVWGRLDGIKVLDVLNPQNFREFIIDELDESRIGLWSAYVDLSLGPWRVEAAVLPDYSAHEIPEPGAWFELTAPRFRFGAAPGSPSPATVTTRDRDILYDGAAGLRLSRSLGRVDVSALAYSGSDHEPLGRLRGDGNTLVVEQYYERRELFGISAETSLGPLALRAETAFQPARVFNTRTADGLSSDAADQLSVGIAADVNAPLGVFLNVQLLWDEVLDAPDDLVRPARDRVATVFARRSFAYETLRVEARWYHSFDDADDLYKLTLDYDLGDNTSVFVSGDWFAGVSTGLFGQFAERDRLVVGVRHTF